VEKRCLGFLFPEFQPNVIDRVTETYDILLEWRLQSLKSKEIVSLTDDILTMLLSVILKLL